MSPDSLVEIYDPVLDEWSRTARMLTPRIDHRTTLLPDGTALASGGRASLVSPLAFSELYIPGAGSWSPTALVRDPRWGQVALSLADGSPMIIGGLNNDGRSLKYRRILRRGIQEMVVRRGDAVREVGTRGHCAPGRPCSDSRRRGQPGGVSCVG